MTLVGQPERATQSHGDLFTPTHKTLLPITEGELLEPLLNAIVHRGYWVGDRVGDRVGDKVGDRVGESDGKCDGDSDGKCDGEELTANRQRILERLSRKPRITASEVLQ